MITGQELAEIHLEVDEQTTNQHDGAYDTGHQNRQDSQGCYVKKKTFARILWRVVTKYIFGKLRPS